MIHLQHGKRSAPMAEQSADRILHLPIAEISPDPRMMRTGDPPDRLRELADSVAQFGIRTPLLVRRLGDGYQIIAGGRLLQAAATAGFTHVPCVIHSPSDAVADCLALIRWLQRSGLDFFEEAAGIARLIREFGFTQEETSLLLGISPPELTEKLRLLKLDGEAEAMIRKAGLSERHALSLLRLKDNAAIRSAIAQIVRSSLSAAETDEYVTDLLASSRRSVCKPIIRDVRLLVNTVRNALKTANAGGVPAEMEQTETPEAITLVIRLPRKSGYKK